MYYSGWLNLWPKLVHFIWPFLAQFILPWTEALCGTGESLRSSLVHESDQFIGVLFSSRMLAVLVTGKGLGVKNSLINGVYIVTVVLTLTVTA